jgi:RNA polymerase sigma-70 factor (ECF subfamily)
LSESAESHVTLDSLARLAGRGDARAFDKLARMLQPRLRRWAIAVVPDGDAAEDVAQAALIQVHRRLPGFRFEARVETWVYRIVRRAAADWFRTAKRNGSLRIRWASVAAREYSATEPAIDERRISSLVRSAFQMLPSRQRVIFDLGDLQGRSTAEIAELLGIEETTVRVHLLRARRAIRERVIREQPALVEDRYGLSKRT